MTTARIEVLEAELAEAVALLREFDQRAWTDCRPGLLWVDRVRSFLTRLDGENT